MKPPALSFVSAGLAALLQLQGFCLGGAITEQGGNIRRQRRNPQADAVRKLKIALDKQTEETTQQKNIAHGLELEVRELQSELQAEKKAFADEKQKEQTVQQKLNKVRAVLDDGSDVKSDSKKDDTGSSMPAAPAAPAQGSPEDLAAQKMLGMQNGQFNDANLNGDSNQAAEALSNVPDGVLDDLPEELPVQQIVAEQATMPKPLTATKEPATKEPVMKEMAPQVVAPPAPMPIEQPSKVVHSMQMIPQDPPPFFEASAVLQSAAVVTPVPAKPAAKVAKHEATKIAKKSESGAHEKAKKKATPKKEAPKTVAPAPKAKHSKRSPALRGAAEKRKKVVAAPVKAKPAPAVAAKPLAVQFVAPAAPPADVKPAQVVPAVVAAPQTKSSEANTVATVKDSDAPPAPTSDFDALEAQLHEEDRRIQDLDRENALDAQEDGGFPDAAPDSSAPAASKAAVKPVKVVKTSAPAQPKLEMDAEAPMEDFLNVEAPGPEATSEAAPTDASLADPGLALPEANANDAALSDNQFLAQIAPAPKHA